MSEPDQNPSGQHPEGQSPTGSGPKSLRGHLLLSAPHMQDPNFMHTVVLICQHDEYGAFGVTVNRTTDALVSDVFPETPVLNMLDLSIRSGGPVSPDSLQILHRLPSGVGLGELESELESSSAEPNLAGVEVAPGVRLGADIEQVAAFLQSEPGADDFARFVVGYSGWGEGQLDEEMKTGSWLPIPATAELVFSQQTGEALWRSALAHVPGGGASLAHLPPDPSWN